MKKIRTFFFSLVKSISSPSYYKDVLKAPASFSWKYFFAFYFLVTIITLASIAVSLFKFDINEVADKAVNVYPKDLEIKVEDGRLSVNQKLPYEIEFPSDVQEENLPSKIIVFDSDENVKGVRDVKDRDAVVVLTESTMYFLAESDTGEIRVYSIPEDSGKFTINYEKINNLKERIVNYPLMKGKIYIFIILLFLLIVMYPFLVIISLITLLFYALVTYGLVSIFMKDKELSYSKVLQITFHSVTLIVIINLLFSQFGVHFFGGWIFFFAYLIWTIFIISVLDIKKDQRKAPVQIASEINSKEKPKDDK